MQMHCKGSRHLAAKSKAKEKELTRRNEINKRLALEGSSTTSSINSSTTKQNARLPSKSKPLIQMAQKAASVILGNKRLEVDSRNENHNTVVPRQNDVKNATLGFSRDHNCSNETSHKLIQNHLDFRECRERELKFTSAGWKRDCHGKWYKDENVTVVSGIAIRPIWSAMAMYIYVHITDLMQVFEHQMDNDVSRGPPVYELSRLQLSQ
ncbi:hypothetical protein Gohar_028298 [Gossypium harknessii]|uniref:Uncharacterized protein n=1 Tax=Gossypium harknessii TaxID=34285 RepID=A0A7J9I8J3_9ROSI|nr:hypothetical protein [Gossypium harknessii]